MRFLNQYNLTQDVLMSNIPVLVHFWAPWCGLCRVSKPMILHLQEEWSEQIKIIEINADENLQLANTYRIKSLPTLILFDQGQVVERFDKFRERADLRNALTSIYSVIESAHQTVSLS